jgi:hypothetical protein
MTFPGGSAWAMARDIAEGYLTITERTLKNLSRAELDLLAFELERHLRDVRGDQAPLDDMQAIQTRNRKIQRVNTAVMVLRSYRAKAKT